MSCDSIEPVAGFEACRNSNSCDKRNQGITLLKAMWSLLIKLFVMPNRKCHRKRLFSEDNN